MGIANDKSLAWGMAKALAASGAKMAFTYQGDSVKKRIDPLAQEVNAEMILPCDVTSDESIDEMFQQIKDKWGKLDFVIHSIAYSDKNELKGRFVDTTLDNFANTMNISCFSLLAVVKRAEKLMSNGGSVITLSYGGSQRVMPNYNVMGVAKAALEASVKYLAADLGRQNIRVNTISAGPVKTLAASGIGDFRFILNWNKNNSPLRRNTDLDDVGGAALYLLSDLGRGTTGETLYVDSGYNVIGMKVLDYKDEENLN